MRRNRKKIELSPKIIYFFIVICCIALVIVSYIFADRLKPIKLAFGNFFTPMQKGIDAVGSKITEKIQMFSDINDLIDDNEKLKEELEKVKSENQMLTQEKYELNWYRDLYELDMRYLDYKKVAARVISRDLNNYKSEFIIDKGTEDGIMVDMNVMSGNGLVGIITEVGKNWAKVRCIIDDESAVSGMFLTTSDKCIVKGNMELLDDGFINVEMININAEIYDNYEIVTSYISDKYLPGILIGYVSNITTDPSIMSKNAYLSPAVDFDHIDAVLVITTLREALEELDEK